MAVFDDQLTAPDIPARRRARAVCLAISGQPVGHECPCQSDVCRAAQSGIRRAAGTVWGSVKCAVGVPSTSNDIHRAVIAIRLMENPVAPAGSHSVTGFGGKMLCVSSSRSTVRHFAQRGRQQSIARVAA